MLLLILFAFIGGIITILSPCILPILPIVLSGSLTGGRKRPFGIITGFILSFTIFTLTLTTIVKATGLPSETLRYFAIAVVLLFGISLLIGQTQVLLEKLMSRFSPLTPQASPESGFKGGILIGLSLGLVWTPCVGPILASIITLASTSSISGAAVAITFAYSLGTAIPMLAITIGGRQLLQKVPWLLTNSAKIQKGFGVVMVATAIGMFFNLDRQFQAYILNVFPEYGTGLTAIEDNELVQNELDKFQEQQLESETGKDSAASSFFKSIRDTTTTLKDYGPAPEITKGTGWAQGEPTTLAALQGKVVLIDFWTYTCINCIRTFPYLKAWDEKYRDQGLEIIGVHSPEFEFEKKTSNVQEAIADFELKYRVVQDNDFGIWKDYSNRYWPAKYLIDTKGQVRYVHFGEGGYDDTEKAIQQLLSEISAVTVGDTVSIPVVKNQTKTPEIYLGYWRHENFSSLETANNDIATSYNYPSLLRSNQWALDGDWLIAEKHAASADNSKLKIRFNAKNVNLVMKPTTQPESQLTPPTVQVLLDGAQISTADAGSDVENGVVQLDKDRLYDLVNMTKPGDHELELIFSNGEVEVFAFTFG
jgi:cytochrome c biogenesis protein CcdA/thiol-disulfide isomerase/thioredoxin